MPQPPSEHPLIRTRLAPPRAGSAPVSRDALLSQLDARRDRKLAVVLGPAGCGKTTLLTQWRKQLVLKGAKVAWYNAGPDDDDALTVAYLVESLRQAGITFEADPAQLYARAGSRAWKPLLAALINSLDAQDSEVYLVIDDFHYLHSYSLLQLIDRWIDLAPTGFHLVLGSRAWPPLDLGTLRAADQLTELNFGDLRFSLDETRRFVETQGLARLDAAQIRALHDMTDGWAAGLQLLAFSLRKHKTPEALFEQGGKLSLSQERALADYLERAVTEHLSAAELDFLTRISICRRFNRELCEILTGDPQAAQHLAKFEAENLFLIPIDSGDAEPWYRFHRLFSSFLHRRLALHPAAEAQRLHGVASRWFAARSLDIEAMRHAALAADTDFVVELIDRAARRMVNSASFVELLRRCDAIPAERLRDRLNVRLCMAWAQLSCGRVEEFDRNIAQIEGHAGSADPQVHTEIQLLKAYHAMRRDDTAASLRIVEPMLEQAPPANLFQSLLLLTIASLSLVYAHQFERAREIARQRYRYDIPSRPDHPKPLIDVVAGFSHVVQGHIDSALATLTAFMDHALRTAALGADAAGLFAGYLLEAYWQSGQVRAAREFLERYGELVDAVGAADGLLFAYRVRARIERLDGHADAARQTLLRLEEIGHRRGLDRLVAWSLYEQAALAQAANPTAATELLHRLERLAAPYRSRGSGAWSEIPLAAALAAADAAFMDAQDPASSLAAIDLADRLAQASGRQLWSVRLGFMRSIVLLRSTQDEEALRVARPFVRDAATHGMNRALVDLGPCARALIVALLQNPADTAAQRYLRAALDALSGPAAEVSGEGPVPVIPRQQATELLTARERDVLHLLAKALSMKGIARALDLSPGTVKWHLKNVYGKLDAGSREDALAKARMLGLVD